MVSLKRAANVTLSEAKGLDGWGRPARCFPFDKLRVSMTREPANCRDETSG